MKVVLFDIDGTLISVRAGKRAMQTALVTHFGTSGSDAYRYDGKTDCQIARELMRAEGFTDDEIDGRMAPLLELYLERLQHELRALRDSITVHPGVPALLEALDGRPDVTLGLLTGNIERGAHAKLGAAGLGHQRFRVGAFGSDHERRDALPAIAQTRAAALLAREIGGNAVVIIGDTPNDIACGRGIGARAIGVATGHYDVPALAEHEPAAVFANLSDTARVVDTILRV